MKKRTKPMETRSIRSYEQIVRRILLNNLSLLFGVLLFASILPLEAALRPVFLIYGAEGYSQYLSQVEQKGGIIRQKVPPQIVVAEIPDTVSPSSLSAQTYFISALPVSSLEPMGPIAVAAGLQWNRRFVNTSQTLGKNNFGAMRVLVAQKSLAPPSGLRTEIRSYGADVQWSGVDGALYYELEASLSPAFRENVIRTRTNAPEARLPLPSETGKFYFRVRAVDHSDGEHSASEDIFGPWSDIIDREFMQRNKAESEPAPEITSPVDRYQTEGFTLIFEWINTGSSEAEIQISRSASFKDLLIDSMATDGEFVCPSQVLHIGDSLYWRVRKWGENASSWSDARRLKIGAPKSTITDMFVNPEMPR